jgi:AcrR family transcriptional regulator
LFHFLMAESLHDRILRACATVYAQCGWRGATTKRIADEAGVNEVTLFRHFGSKDALLQQVLQERQREGAAIALPAPPQDPEQELADWLARHHARTTEHRDFVRQVVSDAHERPDVACRAAQGPSAASAQLRDYVIQLNRHGWLAHPDAITPAELIAASTMLIGAMFADAMNRDLMPALFPQPVDVSLRAYVRIFLRALGVRPAAATGAPPSPASHA